MPEDLSPELRRAMPHSLEAEQSVVGAMLADPEAIDRATSLITSSDFYNRELGLLFEAITELDAERQAIDAVTLQERLRQKNAPPQVSDLSYIASLIEGAPVIENAADYARIVSEKSTIRRLIHATREIENQCFAAGGSTQKLLDDAERQIFAITQKKNTGEIEPIRRIIGEALARIEAASRVSGNVTGIATWFEELDYKTAGFQPSDLILIAARPSMGKTALALNIAQNMLLRGKQTIAFFSLEMSKLQLVNRLLSMHSRVDSERIRTGAQLTENDWASLVESADAYGRTQLIIDDTAGISVAELRSRCRRYKAEKNIGAVFIDYLQLMSGSGKRGTDSRQAEISEISRSLKALARELNVPVVALSQLSREVEKRPDKRPMLSDLRESGAIEQDADVVLFIYREDYYKKDTERKNVADIIIAKQRNGPIGTVELVWLPQYTKFETMAR